MRITNVLNPDNTLSVNRPLAHTLGVNAAIIYAALVAKQAYYEEREMLDNEGYFYSTIDDLKESTALSRAQQQRALNVLLNAGLIEFKVKGTPAKRYFRVIDDEILLENLLAEKLQTSLQETNIQVCEKVTNKFAENSQTSLSKSSNHTYKTKENKSKDINPNPSITPDGADRGTEREKYISLIHKNIEFESIAEKERVSELVEVMVDVICSAKGTVRVNGGELPIEQVRKRFLELNKTHIEQVLTALEKDTNEVRNPRAYLITLLYNSPTTVSNFQPKSNSTSGKFEMQNSSIDMDAVMKRILARYKKCSESE